MLDMASTLDYYGVDYHPARTTQKVLCPVHGEMDPSCNVDMEKGLWHCHSCGEGGTALDLVMKKECISDWREAQDFATEQGLEVASGGGRGGGVQLGLVARKRLPGGRRDQQPKRGYVPPWRR